MLIPLSINWLVDNVIKGDNCESKIVINIVDGFDAFHEDPEFVAEILELLSLQPIMAVSIEDDRGTYFPFQVAAYIRFARHLLSVDKKILVHIHGGAGFENASVIEALLNGADGVWGGVTKQGATIGHASLGELIANLIRAGNKNMNLYQVSSLLPLVDSLRSQEERMSSFDSSGVSTNAYRLTHSFFRQKTGRYMDLPPEVIGGAYGYRICPEISDAEVILGRLSEILKINLTSLNGDLVKLLQSTMIQDMRDGKKIDYDEESNLVDLYNRVASLV